MDSRQRTQDRWQTLGFALLASADKQADPDVRKAGECFVWQLQQLERQVNGLVGGDKSAEAPAPGCTAPASVANVPSLVDAYSDAKADVAQKFKEIDSSLDARLNALPPLLSAAIANARVELTDKLVAAGDARIPKVSAAELEKQLGNLDAIVQSTLASVERARDLAAKIRVQALRVANDPEAQSKLALELFRTIEQQPDIFEARQVNPPALLGERVLSMRYGDTFQGYMLAPWYGVPFRVKELAGASFEGTVALPILDVVGTRWQFGTSRFSDLRLAIGIAGFMDKDKVPAAMDEDPAVDDGGESSTKDVFNGAAHFSLGFGTLKVAVGMVFNNRTMFKDDNAERLRIFVGADLLKMITGRNVELL